MTLTEFIERCEEWVYLAARVFVRSWTGFTGISQWVFTIAVGCLAGWWGWWAAIGMFVLQLAMLMQDEITERLLALIHILLYGVAGFGVGLANWGTAGVGVSDGSIWTGRPLACAGLSMMLASFFYVLEKEAAAFRYEFDHFCDGWDSPLYNVDPWTLEDDKKTIDGNQGLRG